MCPTATASHCVALNQMIIVHYISYPNAGASSTLQVTFLWQCAAAPWWCGGHLYEATDSPGHVSTAQVCISRTSVAVKLNGVDRRGDGSSSVTSPLLLCLFMPERLAFGELENIVGFLAPVPIGPPLKEQKRNTHCQTVSWSVTLAVLQQQHLTGLTFASKELSKRRGSTATSSSLILRNGTLEDWKIKSD